MNEELVENYERLKEISEMPFDWNGYGADPIPESVISNAHCLLGLLDWQPEIFPTARKSLQFEYVQEDTHRLTFELFESGKIIGFCCDPFEKLAEWNLGNADLNFEISAMIMNRLTQPDNINRRRTNADVIREMSDEDLAEWNVIATYICDVDYDWEENAIENWTGVYETSDGSQFDFKSEAIEYELHWLRQEEDIMDMWMD